MFWVKSCVKGEKLLIVDTVDNVEEWHSVSSIKNLLCATGIQIFGVKKEGTKFSFRAMEDPRDYLIRELKRFSKNFTPNKEHGYLSIRDFGNWEISDDDKREMEEEYGYVEDDWDWQVPDSSTGLFLEELMEQTYQNYGYKIFYEVGEKCWLYFTDTR